jgi:hypothetical protein
VTFGGKSALKLSDVRKIGKIAEVVFLSCGAGGCDKTSQGCGDCPGAKE